jgi:hypothetical protein
MNLLVFPYARNLSYLKEPNERRIAFGSSILHRSLLKIKLLLISVFYAFLGLASK